MDLLGTHWHLQEANASESMFLQTGSAVDLLEFGSGIVEGLGGSSGCFWKRSPRRADGDFSVFTQSPL